MHKNTHRFVFEQENQFPFQPFSRFNRFVVWLIVMNSQIFIHQTQKNDSVIWRERKLKCSAYLQIYCVAFHFIWFLVHMDNHLCKQNEYAKLNAIGNRKIAPKQCNLKTQSDLSIMQSINRTFELKEGKIYPLHFLMNEMNMCIDDVVNSTVCYLNTFKRSLAIVSV